MAAHALLSKARVCGFAAKPMVCARRRTSCCAIADRFVPLPSGDEMFSPRLPRFARASENLNNHTDRGVATRSEGRTFAHNAVIRGRAGTMLLSILEDASSRNEGTVWFHQRHGKNCVFRFNGGYGSALRFGSGRDESSSSLFYANSGGGLLRARKGVATIDNCTFTANRPACVQVTGEAFDILFRH